MATSFHWNARRPHIGLKEGSKFYRKQVGFYPFRGPDAPWTLVSLYPGPLSIQDKSAHRKFRAADAA
jgi:hypothetical protein